MDFAISAAFALWALARLALNVVSQGFAEHFEKLGKLSQLFTKLGIERENDEFIRKQEVRRVLVALVLIFMKKWPYVQLAMVIIALISTSTVSLKGFKERHQNPVKGLLTQQESMNYAFVHAFALISFFFTDLAVKAPFKNQIGLAF